MTTNSMWPNNAQCAAMITVNYDGESVERSERPEGGLWGRFSYGRYATQSGVPRMLELFERHQVPATFFVPGWDVERDPGLLREIRDCGHEIAGHGYLHEDFSALNVEQQREVLKRSEQAFGEVLELQPAGWRAPYGLMTAETRGLLADRGYQYDSSYCDDDVPYRVRSSAGAVLVEVPVFRTASDSHYYDKRRFPADVAKAWQTEFRSVYQNGSLFNLTLHPRGDFGSGRAVRLRGVDALIQTIKQQPGVWWTTGEEIATWAKTSDHDEMRIWPA